MNEGRGTIFLAEAVILAHESHASDQSILRVQAPDAARSAEPGSFAHLVCDSSVPMRRPLSIMRANADEGWLEFLYKPVGAGLAKLSQRVVGDRISVLAPIGRGFRCHPDRPRVIAIGGGVGIPPMVFLADRLRADASFRPVVYMGSEVPFPFDVVGAGESRTPRSRTATSSLRLLENWGIPSHLASNAGLPGTYAGHVTELARETLDGSDQATRGQMQIVACGPEPMLRAAAELAAAYSLPCQLALEEYMACGVGGCAGCTVLLETRAGPAMKRVCVDGPVFDAREVYPAAWA